jgi:cob(I)alamin adenosyltransferase
MESNYLHLSRVVCRRLERVFYKYVHESRGRDLEVIGKYFNRLSDLLFILARLANEKRKYKDIVWKALK